MTEAQREAAKYFQTMAKLAHMRAEDRLRSGATIYWRVCMQEHAKYSKFAREMMGLEE